MPTADIGINVSHDFSSIEADRLPKASSSCVQTDQDLSSPLSASLCLEDLITPQAVRPLPAGGRQFLASGITVRCAQVVFAEPTPLAPHQPEGFRALQMLIETGQGSLDNIPQPKMYVSVCKLGLSSEDTF